jgi:hypothetical protein
MSLQLYDAIVLIIEKIKNVEKKYVNRIVKNCRTSTGPLIRSSTKFRSTTHPRWPRSAWPSIRCEKTNILSKKVSNN